MRSIDQLFVVKCPVETLVLFRRGDQPRVDDSSLRLFFPGTTLYWIKAPDFEL